MLIHKKPHLLICLLIILLLTGCWDNVPIEERGFVVGSALDMKDGKINGNYHLTLTNQFVIPAAIGMGSEGETGGQDTFVNLSASGDSVYAMDEEMASLTSKMPFFEHLKLLVVSESLVSTPHLLANILDVFVRDKEMRRSVKVVVAKDQAKDLLDVKPKNAKLPAIYIDDMLEDSLEKTSLFKPILVGDIHEYLLTNSSFTIPKMTAENNLIKYEDAAVFQSFDDKMVGSLNKEEMTALNLITDGTHGGVLEFEYEGHLITYKIYNAKSAIQLDVQDPRKIKIKVDIGVEGGIAEVFGNRNLNDTKNMDGVEEVATKKIEEIVNNTVEKAQKELNADIFGFGKKMNQRHYKVWQNIKDDWDHGKNYFAKSDVQIVAKAKVRTTGASEKTEGNRKE